MKECTTILARMKVQRTIKDRAKVHSIQGHTEIEKVRTLHSGNQVLVYQEASRWREYELVKVSGHEAKVVMPSGKISSFPINMIRPLCEETYSSVSNDDDASKAFDAKTNTKTKRAKHHMTTLLRIRNKNFGTGTHSVNSENNKNAYSLSRT